MSVATDARAEFERLMRVGDDAIIAGVATQILLQGPRAVEVQKVAASYLKTVESLEEAEGLRWDGERHQGI